MRQPNAPPRRRAGDAAGDLADIRQHSAFHRDTIGDRIHPAK
jgi:hypothetical protein